MTKLALFTFLVALAPMETINAAARKPVFVYKTPDSLMDSDGDQPVLSPELESPQPFDYTEPTTTRTPEYIWPRLEGYGWMSQHPLTLLRAAFDNTIDTAKNSKIIIQGALHRAINSGNTAAAAKALNAGANPCKLDASGWSPLHHACSDARCTEIVKLMIAYGADITKTTKVDKKNPALPYGYTPLYIAIANENHETVAVLRAHGATD